MESNKDYETTVRSNESIRDCMDGKLEEPRKVQSTECGCCNNGGCTCGNHSQSCECCKGDK